MRNLKMIGLLAALVVFLFQNAPALYAQQATSASFFAQTYYITTADGAGTLTMTPLSATSTRDTEQPMRVAIWQNGSWLKGSGTYHYLPDDQSGGPPFALVSFAVAPASGEVRFLHGTFIPAFFIQGAWLPPGGRYGGGVLSPLWRPESSSPWTAQIEPQAINDQPQLVDYWVGHALDSAWGGSYSATFNTTSAPVSTATWSAVLSAGLAPTEQPYQVSVFIPAPLPGTVPRTQHAVYRIAELDGSNPHFVTLSQQAYQSGWVPLGGFGFSAGYQITLTDTTGEPGGTRSVVADAVMVVSAVPASAH